MTLPDTPQSTARQRAAEIAAAVDDVYTGPTSYRDETPLPTTGSTPPVPQPGRTPMSQKATDASALMLSAGVASVPLGGMTSLVLYTLGQVDPATLAIAACAPAGIAVPILALARLARRTKEAAPDVHHHHYGGDVHQDHSVVNMHTRAVWAKTRNDL